MGIEQVSKFSQIPKPLPPVEISKTINNIMAFAHSSGGNNARRWNLPSSGARRSHLSPTTNDKLKQRLFTRHQAHYPSLTSTNNDPRMQQQRQQQQPQPPSLRQQKTQPSILVCNTKFFSSSIITRWSYEKC